MAKIIKNKSGENKTYAGMLILDNASYQIPESELLSFQNSSNLMADIATGSAVIYSDTSSTELSGADGINNLMDYSDGIIKSNPFGSKTINGKKLFRRKHGKFNTIAAGQSGVIEIVIPYDSCKINMAEILNCAIGDTVDFKVYDTPAGTISTVPNYMLNQLGFDCELPDGTFKDKSEYDADLIKDMKIEVTYKNNGSEARRVGVNFTLHEVVS